ncbi:hypothetical protein HG531_000281 [Fusarium graminearum]|nr:hypothetical protein HG531_000281 [Fusarium graminearum]
MLSSPPGGPEGTVGPEGIEFSPSGYGGTTGIFCIVLLESEDCSDIADCRDDSRWALKRRGDLFVLPLDDGKPSVGCPSGGGWNPFSRPSSNMLLVRATIVLRFPEAVLLQRGDNEDVSNLVAIGLGHRRGASRAQQGHNIAHVANYILTSRFILREPADCTDLAEALEARACSAGEMDRTGTLGGGPGSAPGERRWAKAR